MGVRRPLPTTAPLAPRALGLPVYVPNVLGLARGGGGLIMNSPYTEQIELLSKARLKLMEMAREIRHAEKTMANAESILVMSDSLLRDKFIELRAKWIADWQAVNESETASFKDLCDYFLGVDPARVDFKDLMLASETMTAQDILFNQLKRFVETGCAPLSAFETNATGILTVSDGETTKQL